MIGMVDFLVVTDSVDLPSINGELDSVSLVIETV